MGFWIFMLIMNILVPITMIGFGMYFRKTAPKQINYVFGYRTRMSMINQDTWEFAHHHCGRSWYITGWVMLPVSVIAMLFLLGKDIDVIGNIGAVILYIQCVPLLGSIIPTEIALRKTFDKQGKRKI